MFTYILLQEWIKPLLNNQRVQRNYNKMCKIIMNIVKQDKEYNCCKQNYAL